MWSKKKKLKVWEYEPYAFERGKVYVMEVNAAVLSRANIRALDEYYVKHGITIKLVPTMGNMPALQPVEARRGMEG